jgi:hypothetical protein
LHNEAHHTELKYHFTIERLNSRITAIDPGDGTLWRVGFGLLRHVLDV